MKVTIPGRLWRAGKHFDMVHDQDCYVLKRVSRMSRWTWADDRSLHEIAEARHKGLEFCKVCDPLGEYEARKRDSTP